MNDVKKIPTSIVIKEFLITFSYETRKGYYREQQRSLRTLDESNVKSLFNEWAKTVRTMFNVKILGIVELEEKRQVIAL